MIDISQYLDDAPDVPVTSRATKDPGVHYVGVGGIQVHKSTDGKHVQIGYVPPAPDVPKRVQSTPGTGSSRNTKFFGCNVTGEATVTVNEGKIYFYRFFGSSGFQNIRQYEAVIPQQDKSGLLDGDKIYLGTRRQALTYQVQSASGQGGDLSFWDTWEYNHFENGEAIYVIHAEDDFPETLGGPYFYHLATYYAADEDTGAVARVEQKHDGFIQMPMIWLPNDTIDFPPP